MLFIRKIELLEANYCSAYNTYKYIIYDVYPVCNQYLTRCNQTNSTQKKCYFGSERSKGGRGGGSDVVSHMDFKERITRYVKK